jgi:hypothetical protein
MVRAAAGEGGRGDMRRDGRREGRMGRGESYRGQQFADRSTNLLPGRRPTYRQQQQNTNMQALGAIRSGGGGGYRRDRE